MCQLSWGDNDETETFPFISLDGQWRDVEISLTDHPQGASLTVSLDGQEIVEEIKFLMATL